MADNIREAITILQKQRSCCRVGNQTEEGMKPPPIIEILNLDHSEPTEPYDFYCDKRSPVGNPYPMYTEANRNTVCYMYKGHFERMMKNGPSLFTDRIDLMISRFKEHRKLRLFCHCAPLRCHCETIREYIIERGKNV